MNLFILDHNFWTRNTRNSIIWSILDVSDFVKMLWFMSLCYEVFDCSLEFVFFSAVTSAFQLFTRKLCLQFSGLRMRNFTWNRFPIKNLLIDSLLTPIVESTYLNRDMCKFESSQNNESRWQSTDSSKAYRSTSAFKCLRFVLADDLHTCFLVNYKTSSSDPTHQYFGLQYFRILGENTRF